jgi:hypothetical protein
VPPAVPQVPVTPAPEPSTIILFASGLTMCAVVGVRKRRVPRSR